MGKKLDLTGKRFGRLVAMKAVGRDKQNSVIWLCRCDCGTTKNAVTRHLRYGHVKSCGCSRIKKSDAARFREKVNVLGPSECWEWQAARQKFGYGVFWTRERPYVHAHRFSYLIHRGPIPHAMQVLHRCDNPACVNPNHLFLGTAADNMYDRAAKGHYARGKDSWSARNKHRVARGERHGSKTKPWAVPRGERHWMAKLACGDIREIRSLLSSGFSHRQIAERFGVDRTTITAINRGVNWSHTR